MNVTEFERVRNLKFFFIPVRLGGCDKESFASAREFERAFRRDGVHDRFCPGTEPCAARSDHMQ